jgi:hypothetical protein
VGGGRGAARRPRACLCLCSAAADQRGAVSAAGGRAGRALTQKPSRGRRHKRVRFAARSRVRSCTSILGQKCIVSQAASFPSVARPAGTTRQPPGSVRLSDNRTDHSGSRAASSVAWAACDRGGAIVQWGTSRSTLDVNAKFQSDAKETTATAHSAGAKAPALLERTSSRVKRFSAGHAQQLSSRHRNGEGGSPSSAQRQATELQTVLSRFHRHDGPRNLPARRPVTPPAVQTGGRKAPRLTGGDCVAAG